MTRDAVRKRLQACKRRLTHVVLATASGNSGRNTVISCSSIHQHARWWPMVTLARMPARTQCSELTFAFVPRIIGTRLNLPCSISRSGRSSRPAKRARARADKGRCQSRHHWCPQPVCCVMWWRSPARLPSMAGPHGMMGASAGSWRSGAGSPSCCAANAAGVTLVVSTPALAATLSVASSLVNGQCGLNLHHQWRAVGGNSEWPPQWRFHALQWVWPRAPRSTHTSQIVVSTSAVDLLRMQSSVCSLVVPLQPMAEL